MILQALYLYLTAEYITETNVLNEMVLWDKIVMNGEKMELDMKSAKVNTVKTNSSDEFTPQRHLYTSFDRVFFSDEILLQKLWEGIVGT